MAWEEGSFHVKSASRKQPVALSPLVPVALMTIPYLNTGAALATTRYEQYRVYWGVC